MLFKDEKEFMARKKTHTRAATRKNEEEVENALEQVIDEDDNLLPAPEDLDKYKQIDPRFIDYFMERGIKEQDNRHYMNRRSIDFFSTVEKNTTWLEYTRLYMAIIIVIIFTGLTYFLIKNGYEIGGSIFGSLAIVLIVQAFVKRDNDKEKSPIKKETNQQHSSKNKS